ncbi:hypothetical protein MPSEU_000649300 [Mayamaea pseudoterrestris]|nr:hypothetical protein MPSEU_000649300 [Mayamaea pseudoterrestris]
MDQVGTDFAASGSVLSRQELENQRRKRGECVTCGRKCFQKKLFKLIPITEEDRVLEGRCLKCKPIDNKDQQNKPMAAVKPTTREDMARFAKSQSNLHLSGPGVASRSDRTQSSTRRTGRNSSDSRDVGYRTAPNRQWSSQSGAQSVSSDDSNGSQRDFKRSITAHNSCDTLATAPPSLGNTSSSLNFSQHSPHGRRSDFGTGSQHGASYNDERYVPSAGGAGYDGFVPAPLNRGLSGESLSSMRSGMEDLRQRRLEEDSYSYHNHGQSPGALGQYLSDVHPQQLYHESNNSQRSLHSHHTDASSVNPYQRSGTLNRGGQISFNPASMNMSNSGSNRSLRSHHSARSNRNSSHVPMNTSRLQSTRSLESMNSFGEDDQGSHHRITSHDTRRGVDRRGSGDKPIIGMRQRPGEDLSLSHHSDASRKQTYRQFSNRQLAGHDSSQNSSSLMTQNSSLLSVTVASRDSSGLDRLHVVGADYVEIVHVMREFHDSAVVQSTALQQLSNMDMSEGDSNRFALAGGIDAVVEAMRQFPMDVDIQIGGCRATWNASGTTANQMTFVEAGALDVILLAMGQFLADVVLQEQAMAALANLGAAELNVETMMERGAVGAIVEAMNKHADNIHVQMKGCGAITNMASHMTPLKQVIMDAGGGGAVVIAMVMHPDDFVMQEKALRALRNLSANCEHNKIELATMGGIDAVISAMQVHRDAAGVQEAGAWTLSNLAGNIENKILIGEYGGVDVTIRAMWVHSDDVKVQEWCCRALFSLSLDVQNGALIREVGGVSAVVNAMQAHVDRSVIQEMGCAVLCNLATDDANKMRIVDEEALDAIVLGMVIHSDDAKVQERACQVLLQLAILENCKSMQASNVGTLVAAAAEHFPEQCANLADLLLRSLENFAAEYNQIHS